MNSGVSWQVEGVRREAQETALEAARRCGLSIGEWLDAIIGRASSETAEPGRRRFRSGEHFAHAQEIAAASSRLEELGRELDRLSRLNATPPHPRPSSPEGDPRDLTDAISRLDRRLDRLMSSGRRPEELARAPAAPADDRSAPPSPGEPASPLDQALMEIAERQRTLYAEADPAADRPTRADLPPLAPTQSLSSLEEQLRELTRKIENLRLCGTNQALETLRDDLAEIGLMLKEAMPRKAIEALESEVRTLSERLQRGPETEGAQAAFARIEQGLADVRDTLRSLAPAENLLGIDASMKELAHRIDLMAPYARDARAIEPLAATIADLREMVAHSASNGALASLSEDVHALAVKVDQIASSAGSGADLLSTLEDRIASLSDTLKSPSAGGLAAAEDVDAAIRGLADRLERLEVAHPDQSVVGQLEERISALVDKLDRSSSRLDQLENIERGLSGLLAGFERRQQSEAPAAAARSVDTGALQQDMQATRDSLATVRGALGDLIDRLPMIEQAARSPIQEADPCGLEPAPETPPAKPTAPALSPSPAADLSPSVGVARPAAAAELPSQIPTWAQERRPIDPSLPPDHPLEPGAVRGRGSSPAERIAASEAAFGLAKPPLIPEAGDGKANFIAAARRAAQAAGGEARLRGEKPASTAESAVPAVAGKVLSRWGGRARSLLVAASVVVIVLGSLHVLATLFVADKAGNVSPPELIRSSPEEEGRSIVAPAPGNPRLAAPAPVLPLAPATDRQSLLAPMGGGGPLSMPFAVPPIKPAPPAPPQGATAATTGGDVTGSLARPASSAPAQPASSAPAQPASRPATVSQPTSARLAAIEKLPAAIGSALRAAAAKDDPGAEFEIGQRFADGRGVPQNPAEAADWFERAAKQGLAPAQFRLGGLYEKGFGVKKDLEVARRLYTAAADAGNAKAMHNLAVLYAEGVDAKPDYAAAARWFRKAADHGVTDSQYNLGILYARGIGVEASLSLAYKWFALAAREGDREAGSKRDDIASRLDPQALATAKLEVQGFSPLDQPEGAAEASVPSGGWDVVAPTPANPKPRAAAPKAELGNPPAR
jgi:localization factor PodJL